LILEEQLDLEVELIALLSAELKSILNMMLEKDPKSRPSIDEVLDHPWLSI